MMQAHAMGMGLIGVWEKSIAETIYDLLKAAGLEVSLEPDE